MLCMVVFIGCAGQGCMAAARLTARRRAIETTQQALDALGQRLMHYKEPLPQAVRRTAALINGEAGHWLKELTQELEDGKQAYTALKEMMDTAAQNKQAQALGLEEKAALCELFERIGSHEADQTAAFALCKERLCALKTQAEANEQSRGKLYRAAGALIGAGLAVLLL